MELLVDEAHGGLAILLGDDERDIQLARALRDRDDVHARLPERAEDARGDTGRAAHPFPHRGDDGDGPLDGDALHVVPAELRAEHALERALEAIGRRGIDDEADGVLARGLADHHHRDALGRRRVEDPRGEAGDAAHPRALDRDEAEVAYGGRRLHDAAVARRVGRDRRARVLRHERVEDPNRDPALDRWQHGARMDHLRAEVAELRGLGVRERPQRLGALDDARVGAHHAAHVGVDAKLARVDRGREHAGGVVRGAAAERRRDALGGRADEPRHDGRHPDGEAWDELLGGAGTRLLEARIRLPEGVVGDHETFGGERLRLHALRLEDGGDDGRGHALPVGEDRVARAGGALAEDRDALQECDGALREVADLLQDLARREAERVGGEVLVRLGELADLLLSLLGVAALGVARRRDERVSGAGRRGDDDDALAFDSLDDLADLLERGRRGDGGPAELEDGPSSGGSAPRGPGGSAPRGPGGSAPRGPPTVVSHRVARAIWITSPSIAEAVASPPAPGPLHTRCGARSLSSVTTFVGPVAWPSSESAATSSGPTRAFVAFSPKSATAR